MHPIDTSSSTPVTPATSLQTQKWQKGQKLQLDLSGSKCSGDLCRLPYELTDSTLVLTIRNQKQEYISITLSPEIFEKARELQHIPDYLQQRPNYAIGCPDGCDNQKTLIIRSIINNDTTRWILGYRSSPAFPYPNEVNNYLAAMLHIITELDSLYITAGHYN